MNIISPVRGGREGREQQKSVPLAGFYFRSSSGFGVSVVYSTHGRGEGDLGN